MPNEEISESRLLDFGGNNLKDIMRELLYESHIQLLLCQTEYQNNYSVGQAGKFTTSLIRKWLCDHTKYIYKFIANEAPQYYEFGIGATGGYIARESCTKARTWTLLVNLSYIKYYGTKLKF